MGSRCVGVGAVFALALLLQAACSSPVPLTTPDRPPHQEGRIVEMLPD